MRFDELEEKLKLQAKRRGVPLEDLIREYLEKGLLDDYEKAVKLGYEKRG